MDFSSTILHGIGVAIGFILGAWFMRWRLHREYSEANTLLNRNMISELELTVRENNVTDRERIVFEKERMLRDLEARRLIANFPGIVNRGEGNNG